MKNKLVLILLVVLLPICVNSQVKEFKFSNMPNAEIAFTIRDNFLEISNIPNDKHYSNVRFEREDEKVIDGKVSFKLPYEKDGRYSIFSGFDEIWAILKNENNYNWGWLSNSIYLLVDNGKYFFEISPVYEINKLIYLSDKNSQDFLNATYSIQSDNEEIVQKAKEITANCKTDYEKAKAVHDWLASNIYYNMDGYYSSSYGSTDALGVLKDKKTVCAGYANLTAAMLRSLQIPCRVVNGLALGLGENSNWSIHNIDKETNHAWNEAFISGRWIIIDVTWDSDMQYINGKFENRKGLIGWIYFDPTLEAFSRSHKCYDYNDEINTKITNIIEDYVWQTSSSEHKKSGNDAKINEYILKHVTDKSKEFLRSYEDYKKKYPTGRYINDCEVAMSDIKMIIDYLSNGNISIYNQEAVIDKGDWRDAVKENTEESYLRYKTKHPAGLHIEDCEKELRIHEAKNAWKSISGSKDEKKLLDFITKYYDCREVELAKQQLSNFYEVKGDIEKANSQWNKAIEFYDKAIIYNNTPLVLDKKSDAYSEILYSIFATNQNIENGERYIKECHAEKYFIPVYEKLYGLYFNAAESAYKVKRYDESRKNYVKITERERNDKIFKIAEKRLTKMDKDKK
jgi:hypothetical protein